MKYRADIQLLRGLSVLMVVLYHLQPGIVKSGFLGVDVFFVISGFLMAVLYYARAHDTNITKQHVFDKDLIVDFYARRLRRILPAYFFTIIAVLAIGILWLNNAEYRDVTRHAVYAGLLIPNIPYWLESSYFDLQYFRPLLHLWSIGVELQFYLLVPFIFALLHRSKQWLFVIALVSLIICMAISDRSSNTAFYMLPLRFWEFMLGFFAATFLTNNGNTQHNKPLLGLLALSVIIVIALLDANFNLRHPGPAALVICLATSIILITGLPQTLLDSFVGTSFIKLGRYSYSLYLCHFPVILFANYRAFEGAVYGHVNLLGNVLMVVIILLASVLLYHWVEVPFRKPGHRLNAISSLFTTIAIVICLAVGLNYLQRNSYTEPQLRIVNAVHDRSTFRCGTVFGLIRPLSKSCDLTHNEENASKRYLLVGNSHADAIKTSFAESAIEHGHAVRFWKDNFPLGWANTTVENVIAEANKFNINAIVLHTSEGTLMGDAVRDLLQKTRGLGIQIVYIDPVPIWKQSVPGLLWKEVVNNQTRPAKSRDQHHYEHSTELLELNAITDEAYPNFVRIRSADFICNYYCPIANNQNTPLYYDSHHLNLTGARRLKPLFASIFR